MSTSLSIEQEQAAFIFDRPVCILAGAGSGKTRVITHRIAHLINNKMALPYEILGVTFTNKAAKEMKERVALLLGDQAFDVNLGTFHGLAAKFLRYYGEFIGIERNFLIYDEDDATRLIKKIIRESYVLGKEELADLVAQVLSLKNSEKVNNSFNSHKARAVLDIYLAQTKQINALDFNQLLKSFLDLLQNKEAYERISYKIKHLLVDEYQDINLVQSQIINLLAKNAKSVAIVGDDDQSIYSWRGASSKFMSDFISDFSNTKLVRLEENYRSTAPILKAANAVISNNEERLGKELVSIRGHGPLIRVRKHYRDSHEALMLTEQVLREFEQHGKDFEIAVLMRTNALSRALEEAFHKAKIPYRIIGGMKFYDRKEIKDILAALKSCLFHNSDVDLLRLLDCLPLGIGKKTIEQLITYSTANKLSLFETMSNSQHLEQSLDNARAKKKIDDLVKVLIKAKSYLNSKDITASQAIMFVIEQFDFIARLEHKNDEESQGRIANIEQLVEASISFVTDSADKSIISFLENVALISKDELSNEKHQSNIGSITLMTLHAAKGLEFDAVFLIGLEEGILPHSRSTKQGADALEEERRLLYVGMTRAKTKLFVSFCQERFIHGKVCPSLPSRFLKEVPLDCIDERDRWFLEEPTSHKHDPETVYSYAYEIKKPVITSITNDFSVGNQVYHKIFSKGKILGINLGLKPSAKVHFYSDNQIRIIMLNFLSKC